MKGNRQTKILELIQKYDVETQDDLLERLQAEGISATQATVSRDIRDLRLTKVSIGKGRYKYIKPHEPEEPKSKIFSLPLHSSITSADYAQNIIIVKTVPSMASAIGSGVDNMNMKEIIGCVAGDDCVLIVTRTEADASAICNKVRKLIQIS